MEPGRSETILTQKNPEPFPSLSWDLPRDYQFIDLVAVLDGAIGQGFISRFDRTVSHSYAGWQLWLPGIQGVFELLLKSHAAEALTLRAEVVAQYHRTDFLLKYYPDPSEKVFETFSLYERILRQSEVFNGQSTPREEVKEKLHETYFTVGEMTLALSSDHQAVGLCLRSQDEWRETRSSPLSARDSAGKLWRLPAGAVDRRVPGWKISQIFFIPLIRAYARRYGNPKFLRLTEFKGRVWRVGKKGVESRWSPRVRERRLDVGFVHGPDPLAKNNRAKHLRRYFEQFSSGRAAVREKPIRDLDSFVAMASSYSD